MDKVLLLSAVIFLFSIIHFIEISSFISRISGILMGRTAMAYALQNAVYMNTRFFTMLLLPLIGLLVDMGIDKRAYLLMAMAAVSGATILGVTAILAKDRLISTFNYILDRQGNGGSLFALVMRAPLVFFQVTPVKCSLGSFRMSVFTPLFWMSAVVFAVYASSLFVVFYGGLEFPLYRTSLSQLSGALNALAAVVLTFWIEPRISRSIDFEQHRPDVSANLIYQLILGRIFGLSFISQITLFFIMAWRCF